MGEPVIREPAMREAYGDALLELAADEKVVVMDADLAEATSSAKFAKAYPDRFFDMGIAEQNMMGAAAGMALGGLKPFVSTFALFGTGRAYEPVRNAICYQKLPVHFVGTHAGLSANSDGGSHESVEDLALMRVLPGMTVLSPCDYEQAKDMIRQMKDWDGPAYIRLSRHPAKPVTAKGEHTEIGRIKVERDGADLCFAATGIMVAEALEAAHALAGKGIEAAVLNVHTIKPLDTAVIQAYARRCGRIITAEEHSVIGGLGEAVCEAVCEPRDPAGGAQDKPGGPGTVPAGAQDKPGGLGAVPAGAQSIPCEVVRIGVQDVFGQSGDLEELMQAYGLTAEHLVTAALELMKGKDMHEGD